MPQSLIKQIIIFFSNNSVPISILQISSFISILTISLIFKHFTEVKNIYPKIVSINSFFYFSYVTGNNNYWYFNKIYKLLFHTRLPCLLALLIGLLPRVSISILLISYVSEFILFKKNHVLLTILLLIIILFDSVVLKHGNLHVFTTTLAKEPVIVSAPSVLFIKTLLLTIYLASGIRKYRRKFYTGRVIADAAQFSLKNHMLPIHLSGITRLFAFKILIPYATFFARITICLQLTIPFLLCLGGNFTHCAIFLAILHHIGITLVLPVLLIPFSSIMIAILILWL
jgi:hypothetical protein